MKDLFSIEGKVAVVTGGSRGIGEMIARGFVENGVKTYITSRKEKELNATAEKLSAFGTCIAVPADLSTLDGVKTFRQALESEESRVDILVNNAGAIWGAPIDEFPESGWDKVMDINVKTPFFLVQQFLPLLQAAGSDADPARVINVSSIVSYVNLENAGNYSYSASKAAINRLTHHLASDLAVRNINVNGIAPGFFATKMLDGFADGVEDEMVAAIPRGRFGLPGDAAGTAIYLSAKASAWVTGHTIALDGGALVAAV